MCIRDRYETVLFVTAVGGVTALIAELINRKRLALSAAVVTVSYTHLRAHETVLDLVCRLLLEKKKHKQELTTYVLKQTNAIK